jgi:hypothetical protein
MERRMETVKGKVRREPRMVRVMGAERFGRVGGDGERAEARLL